MFVLWTLDVSKLQRGAHRRASRRGHSNMVERSAVEFGPLNADLPRAPFIRPCPHLALYDIQMKDHLLLLILYGSLVLVGVHGHGHGHECGTAEPNMLAGWRSRWRDHSEETKLFGDSLSYVQ
jgi:hypothetical protein